MMLREKSKLLYYGFFRRLGIYQYLRFKHSNMPVVLTYHGVLPKIPAKQPDYEYRNFVTVKQFEDQICFLIKKYKPLKVSDFYNSSKLNRGFLITFDDGFRNNYSYALPVLQKYSLQACFFITTHFIGTREFIWTERVTRLIQRTSRKFLEVELEANCVFQLDREVNKEIASHRIRKYLKSQTTSIRNKILEQMKDQLKDVDLTLNKEDEERYLLMNWDEVRAMNNSAQVIGSHTHSHPMLSKLTEEESYRELKFSKEAIEKNTGDSCVTMSYPNGEKDDYTEVQKKQLKDLGFKCAFTQIPPFKNYQPDPYELNRLNISLKMRRTIFEAKICGFN